MRSLLPPLVAAAALLAFACKGEDPPPPPGCMLDTDCAADQKCAPDGSCVSGAECTKDVDCGDARKVCQLSDFTCQFRPGFADECAIGRPCAFGQFCSPLLGRCLDAAGARDCTRRSQCPAAQFCDRDANKCVPDPGCFGPEFCDDGELCDEVSRVCRAVTVECQPCAGSTMSCEGGASCVLESKECVAPGAEATCRTGEFCDPLGRCVQCTSNDQCGPGLYCNAAQGRCDSNVQCAADPSECPDSPAVQCVLCERPQVCNARTRRCEAPATECESDVGCPGDQFCDLSLDPPICVPRIPDCLNDLREGPGRNDRANAAAPLPESEGPRYDELKLCPGDVDWYRLEVPAGTYLTIDLRFEHDDGDIDAQLFLPDGVTLLDESRTITDNERVELPVGTDRTLLLKVFLQVPSLTPVPYRVIVSRDAGELCPDDATEPDDGPSEASDLVTDRPVMGRVCSADPDWYALRNVPAGRRIEARLELIDSLGDLDLELYRPDGRAAVASSRSNGDVETIRFDTSVSGDYFLRVFGKTADANVYTLRADLRPSPAAACTDDRFEPNGHPLDATLAPDDTGEAPVMLTACAGDEDWYVMNLGPSELLRAEIAFDADADLELKVYPPGSTSATVAPIRGSSGISGREFVALRPRRPGDYLVRVHGLVPNRATPYELRIRRDPPFLCEPDMIDQQARGQTQMEAFPTPPAPFRIDELTFCAGDEDWFDLPLPAGFRHYVRLQYVDSDATLDFSLVDVAGGVLGSSMGLGSDVKELGVNVPGTFGVAQLFVRVFSSAGFETPYSLVVDSEPLSRCSSDPNEPNDDQIFATEVRTATVPATVELAAPLTLCSQEVNFMTGVGDQDWYAVPVPAAGTRISAALEHDNGDLYLELRSPGGFVRACPNLGPDRCYSDGSGLAEVVSFTSTTAATYFLRVGSIYGDPNVQQRPTDADTAYRLRVTLDRD
jgi:hypothetical protein